MTQKKHGDETTHCCPECGGDPSITHDTRRPWTHPTVLLPKIVWSLTLLGLLALASPWGQQRTGNRYSVWDDTTSPIQSRTTLPEHLVPNASITNAVEGDLQSLDRLDAFLAEIRESANTLGEPVRVRLIAKPLMGTIIKNPSYGFGGVAYSMLSMETVDNVHAPQNHQRAPYQQLSDRTEWWFPLKITEIRHNGAQYLLRTYNPTGVLIQVCMCAVTVWVLRRGTRAIGRKTLEPRYRRRALLALLMVATGLFAIRVPTSDNSVRNLDGFPKPMTGWHPADDLRQGEGIWQDAAHLADALLDAANRPHQANEINADKGELYLVLETDTVLAAQNRYWLAALSSAFPIAKFQRTTYHSAEPPTASNQTEPPAYQHLLPRFEHNGLYWWQLRLGGRDALHLLSFSPGSLCAMLVTSYWAWSGLHGIGRWTLSRTQRKRTKRGQCIFCAYPLSPESLATRADPTTS